MHGGVGFERGPRWGQRIKGGEQRAAETKAVQQKGQRLVSILKVKIHNQVWVLRVGELCAYARSVAFLWQNCGGRLGAASGLKTPAFTSISTDRRWWWIQRRISIRKPALPVDMNLPMKRCRQAQPPPSAFFHFCSFPTMFFLVRNKSVTIEALHNHYFAPVQGKKLTGWTPMKTSWKLETNS